MRPGGDREKYEQRITFVQSGRATVEGAHDIFPFSLDPARVLSETMTAMT